MGDVVVIRRHDFAEGDAVRSKAGGPIMLVAIAAPDVMAEFECIWVERRRLKTAKFQPHAVELVARGRKTPAGAA